MAHAAAYAAGPQSPIVPQRPQCASIDESDMQIGSCQSACKQRVCTCCDVDGWRRDQKEAVQLSGQHMQCGRQPEGLPIDLRVDACQASLLHPNHSLVSAVLAVLQVTQTMEHTLCRKQMLAPRMESNSKCSQKHVLQDSIQKQGQHAKRRHLLLKCVVSHVALKATLMWHVQHQTHCHAAGMDIECHEWSPRRSEAWHQRHLSFQTVASPQL